MYILYNKDAYFNPFVERIVSVDFNHKSRMSTEFLYYIEYRNSIFYNMSIRPTCDFIFFDRSLLKQLWFVRVGSVSLIELLLAHYTSDTALLFILLYV